jgi:hypothetical protein
LLDFLLRGILLRLSVIVACRDFSTPPSRAAGEV